MAERLECAHCKETGTCTSGVNGAACAVCARRKRTWLQKLRAEPSSSIADSPVGLVCSVCEGRGVVEPHSLKLHNRFLPYFSMVFVLVLLGFLTYAMHAKPEHFDKVLGFVTTLIGSITAYYFGGKTSQTTIVERKPPAPTPRGEEVKPLTPPRRDGDA